MSDKPAKLLSHQVDVELIKIIGLASAGEDERVKIMAEPLKGQSYANIIKQSIDMRNYNEVRYAMADMLATVQQMQHYLGFAPMIRPMILKSLQHRIDVVQTMITDDYNALMARGMAMLTSDSDAQVLTYGQAMDMAVMTGCVIKSTETGCTYKYDDNIASLITEGSGDHYWPLHAEIIGKWSREEKKS